MADIISRIKLTVLFLFLVFMTVLIFQGMGNDSYAIYSTILNEKYSRCKKILIVNRTMKMNFDAMLKNDTSKIDEYIKNRISGLSKNISEEDMEEALTDFCHNNKKRKIISNCFRGPFIIKLASFEKRDAEGSIKTILDAPDSDGLIEFSDIGFNDDNTIAYLMVVYYGGPLNMSCSNVVMQKINGKWTIQRWNQFIVS